MNLCVNVGGEEGDGEKIAFKFGRERTIGRRLRVSLRSFFDWEKAEGVLTPELCDQHKHEEGTPMLLGGTTLPTISWQVQLLAACQKTLAHRHNSTTFYFGFAGEGVLVIEGERLNWHKGDIFAVPPWTWHHHENGHDADSILFSIDDWPAMKKLGFYMKQEAKGF